MNTKKESNQINQILLISVVVILLLSIVGVSIFLIIDSKNDKKAHKNEVKLQEIYNSSYDLSMLDKDFYLGETEGKLSTIIDTSGSEVYKFNTDLEYVDIYKTKNDNYLIFTNNNGNVTTFTFDKKTVEQNKAVLDVGTAKPLIYSNNGVEYIIGFISIKEDKTLLYDLIGSDPVELKNLFIPNADGKVVKVSSEEYLSVCDDDNKCGIVNYSGKKIIDNNFDSIETTTGKYFIIRNGNKYGIINNDNDSLFEINNNRIIYSYNYFYVVNRYNKLSIYDKDLNRVVNNKITVNNIASLDIKKVNNKSYFIFADNKCYIFSNNELQKNINTNEFIVDKVIADINGEKLVIYDENLNPKYELLVPNYKSIKEIKYVKDDILYVSYINKSDELETLYFDSDRNTTTYRYTNLVSKKDTYSAYLEADEEKEIAYFVDNNDNDIGNVSGSNIIINNNQIIVDNSIYNISYK